MVIFRNFVKTIALDSLSTHRTPQSTAHRTTPWRGGARYNGYAATAVGSAQRQNSV
jgi:hypothetical protein